MMQEAGDIVELGNMLGRLRAADTRFRVFGSKQHRYRLGPTLSERELAGFEAANRVRLPEDYRRFLAVVGNGGAGPFYGLEPLSTFGRDLSQPFQITTATDALTQEELEQLGDRDEYPGILEFCHHGCAIHSYLVVNGAAYGTIWDGREYFYPTGLAFGEDPPVVVHLKTVSRNRAHAGSIGDSRDVVPEQFVIEQLTLPAIRAVANDGCSTR
jgi:hypothetical protein